MHNEMLAESAFQARGPATESVQSPILVRVRGMSKVAVGRAERRCEQPIIFGRHLRGGEMEWVERIRPERLKLEA